MKLISTGRANGSIVVEMYVSDDGKHHSIIAYLSIPQKNGDLLAIPIERHPKLTNKDEAFKIYENIRSELGLE